MEPDKISCVGGLEVHPFVTEGSMTSPSVHFVHFLGCRRERRPRLIESRRRDEWLKER